MKKVIFILFAVFLITAPKFVSAQSEVIYAAFTDQLTDAQKKKISSAEKKIKSAEKGKKAAKTIEKKYAKLKKKKSKRKAKKYERKTWKAKQYYIKAGNDLSKAYTSIKDVYSEAINAATYYSKTDEDDAKGLDYECDEKFSEGKGKFKKYKGKKKKDLKKLKGKKILAEINSGQKLMEAGIAKQIEALKIILSQGVKKKKNEEDLAAWDKAKSTNTIAAYNSYVSHFSTGKYVSQARIKIKEIRDAEEAAEAARRANEVATANRVFKVQISASHTPLSSWLISSRAKNMKPLTDTFVNDWYKYWAGEFKTYQEAEAYRDTLAPQHGAFIVVFVNGEQTEVTDEMKGQ